MNYYSKKNLEIKLFGTNWSVINYDVPLTTQTQFLQDTHRLELSERIQDGYSIKNSSFVKTHGRPLLYTVFQ